MKAIVLGSLLIGCLWIAPCSSSGAHLVSRGNKLGKNGRLPPNFFSSEPTLREEWNMEYLKDQQDAKDAAARRRLIRLLVATPIVLALAYYFRGALGGCLGFLADKLGLSLAVSENEDNDFEVDPELGRIVRLIGHFQNDPRVQALAANPELRLEEKFAKLSEATSAYRSNLSHASSATSTGSGPLWELDDTLADGSYLTTEILQRLRANPKLIPVTISDAQLEQLVEYFVLIRFELTKILSLVHKTDTLLSTEMLFEIADIGFLDSTLSQVLDLRAIINELKSANPAQEGELFAFIKEHILARDELATLIEKRLASPTINEEGKALLGREDIKLALAAYLKVESYAQDLLFYLLTDRDAPKLMRDYSARAQSIK